MKPSGPPYTPSSVIRQITWAPQREIIRRARGSDNWPLTWADDDVLYTAYGDGSGFEPFVPEKLSMGLSKITGFPPDFQGVNLRSPSVEPKGDDVHGHKASGMLMVDGVLYLLARNLKNAQLAWSQDHGAHVDMGRLEIHDELWLPAVFELREKPYPISARDAAGRRTEAHWKRSCPVTRDTSRCIPRASAAFASPTLSRSGQGCSGEIAPPAARCSSLPIAVTRNVEPTCVRALATTGRRHVVLESNPSRSQPEPYGNS